MKRCEAWTQWGASGAASVEYRPCRSPSESEVHGVCLCWVHGAMKRDGKDVALAPRDPRALAAAGGSQ